MEDGYEVWEIKHFPDSSRRHPESRRLSIEENRRDAINEAKDRAEWRKSRHVDTTDDLVKIDEVEDVEHTLSENIKFRDKSQIVHSFLVSSIEGDENVRIKRKKWSLKVVRR